MSFVGKEAFGGRAFVGRGIEHDVYRGRNGKTVLKVLRPFNRLSLGQDPTLVLRGELKEAHALVGSTSVQIPRTLIVGFDTNVMGVPVKGCVIGQEYIEDDASVLDIGRHLQRQGLDGLVDEYVYEPRNFKSRGGVVYWVDPTRGVGGRILEAIGIMRLQTYRRVKRKLKQAIRSFGL